MTRITICGDGVRYESQVSAALAENIISHIIEERKKARLIPKQTKESTRSKEI